MQVGGRGSPVLAPPQPDEARNDSCSVPSSLPSPAAAAAAEGAPTPPRSGGRRGIAALPGLAAATAAPCGDVGLSWMQAAVVESDLLLTVSPGYAREVALSPSLGHGLQGLIAGKGIT